MSDGAAGGIAGHDGWLDQHAPGPRGVLGLDDVEKEFAGAFADGDALLVDTGQGYPERLVKVEIATANHGDILWNAETGGEDGVDGSDGDGIVVTEDAIRGGIEAEQLMHGPEAAAPTVAVGGASGDDIVWPGAEAMLHQGLIVTFEPADGSASSRAANVGDPAATDGNQVAGGDFSDFDIVDAYEIGAQVRKTPIEENEGNALIDDVPKAAGVMLCGCDEERIEAPA